LIQGRGRHCPCRHHRQHENRLAHRQKLYQ
jgi:hypothetical protein